jgi:predicted RNA-binding Zn-ribbon protein involved in translation (DUF1610 family)
MERVQFWCPTCGVIESFRPDDPEARRQPGKCPRCGKQLRFRLAQSSDDTPVPDADPVPDQ